MPKLRLKRLKRWAVSMVRYGGHISRSLYQGLSSMSLVKRRGTLRMTLAGGSTIGAAMVRALGGAGEWVAVPGRATMGAAMVRARAGSEEWWTRSARSRRA